MRGVYDRFVAAAPVNLFVIGAGHSGSTLLDMLLGGHSEVASLGEVGLLTRFARSTHPQDVCTCGKRLDSCPFWTAVDGELRKGFPRGLAALDVADPALFHRRDSGGHYRERLPHEARGARSVLREALLTVGSRTALRLGSALHKPISRYRSWAQARLLLYAAVRQAHESHIVTDSSKSPGYTKETYLEAGEAAHFVLLLRDGRGVCSSRMRRLGIGMEAAARMWVAEHRKRRLSHLTIPRSVMTVIRYENLCEHPMGELTKICRALGIVPEERMLDFRIGRHNIGGNPMRLRDSERQIVLDDRWRRELDAADLRAFEEIGGALNRRLGYE